MHCRFRFSERFRYMFLIDLFDVPLHKRITKHKAIFSQRFARRDHFFFKDQI